MCRRRQAFHERNQLRAAAPKSGQTKGRSDTSLSFITHRIVGGSAVAVIPLSEFEGES
jgi:hypothetical protein